METAARNQLMGTKKITTFNNNASQNIIAHSTLNEIYYSNTASTLSKRPLGEIYNSKQKKSKGEKSAAMRPSTKKAFFNI